MYKLNTQLFGSTAQVNLNLPKIQVVKKQMTAEEEKIERIKAGWKMINNPTPNFMSKWSSGIVYVSLFIPLGFLKVAKKFFGIKK